MIALTEQGLWYVNSKLYTSPELCFHETGFMIDQTEGKKKTISYRILKNHNISGDDQNLQLLFDSLTSHDITYVGIIQTARASGMTEFPIPYVLTNCHNSLCAVGGTINEDDHKFGLSAAHKYGGIYVPPNAAVIHSFNREMMAGCGKMILGSDSHTRYGALGTMAVGEGGGELAKQLVNKTYDMQMPKVIAVYLTGKPQHGVGPQDIALSLVRKTYANGFVKNAVLEFIGPAIADLPMEYRHGIDVMTTETTCWSSIWETDQKTKDYLTERGRAEDYQEFHPDNGAYYDGCIEIDLSTIESMIALPMHPSFAYSLHELHDNASELLHETELRIQSQVSGSVHIDLLKKIRPNGEIQADQGIIAGCSGGTFDNLCIAANILEGQNCGNGAFHFSVYPGSLPVYIELMKNGSLAKIAAAGGIVRECFCGPCFGAGDTPANGEFSIRHVTRNFPNREGSKPGEGQLAAVALMDARSIAATAARAGKLTAATDISYIDSVPHAFFDRSVYDKIVYNGWKKAESETKLVFGPNITDWPQMPALSKDLLLKITSYITDPVTTTDELIPSGETSSYRSNPLRLAEFTLSRKDPHYVERAKHVASLDNLRQKKVFSQEIQDVYYTLFQNKIDTNPTDTLIESCIYASKPGDGSAREQAASCQRVLGAGANLAQGYATKRYRSNCINWGIIPFVISNPELLALDDYLFIPEIRKNIKDKVDQIPSYVIHEQKVTPILLSIGNLTDTERQILLDGCLINYYKQQNS